MASLHVPESGLELDCSPSLTQWLEQELEHVDDDEVEDLEVFDFTAFAITLSKNVVQGLVACHESGQHIELDLEQYPTFLYGDQAFEIAPDIFSAAVAYQGNLDGDVHEVFDGHELSDEEVVEFEGVVEEDSGDFGEEYADQAEEELYDERPGEEAGQSEDGSFQEAEEAQEEEPGGADEELHRGSPRRLHDGAEGSPRDFPGGLEEADDYSRHPSDDDLEAGRDLSQDAPEEDSGELSQESVAEATNGGLEDAASEEDDNGNAGVDPYSDLYLDADDQTEAQFEFVQIVEQVENDGTERLDATYAFELYESGPGSQKAARLIPYPVMTLFGHYYPIKERYLPKIWEESILEDGTVVRKLLSDLPESQPRPASAPSTEPAPSGASASPILPGSPASPQPSGSLRPPKPSRAPGGTPSIQRAFGDKADDALEKLKNAFAQIDELKQEHSATLISGIIPTDKKGRVKATKAKLLPGKSSPLRGAVRPLPSSPNLPPVGSPSLLPVDDSETREKRFQIIHELAIQPRTWDYLFDRWDQGSMDEFQNTLKKVASFDDNLQAWTPKKICWKELDVYAFPYASEEDRKSAIDNAIRHYDRMRLGPLEPEWERLLPREERGKGKCLSKVQAARAKNAANVANAANVPAVKMRRSDSSGSNASADSELSRNDSSSPRPSPKSKDNGEAMGQSSSQPGASKSKKASKREELSKLALSNTKKDLAAKKNPAQNSSAAKAAQKGGKRVLSKEFISDSDSDSSDELPLSVTHGKARMSQSVDVVSPKPSPPEKSTSKMQAATTSLKRSPGDEDSSSSSGTPLSKRQRVKKEKPKEGAPAPAPTKAQAPGLASAQPAAKSQKPRPPEVSSQNPLGASPAKTFLKTLNTSPVKSSPLASSPPTNASDLDPVGDTTITVAVTKKRKLSYSDDETESSDEREKMAKRARSVSTATLSKAHRYRAFYPKYERMHKAVLMHEDPPPSMVRDLLDMRERLEKMKAEIYQEVSPVG